MSTHPHPLKLQSPSSSKYQRKIVFQDISNDDGTKNIRNCYDNPLFDKRSMSKLFIKDSDSNFSLDICGDDDCSSRNIASEVIFSKNFVL